VEDAVAVLGYQPNRAAQTLKRSTSRLIGYRIEPVHSESLANIHDRFLHALADAGREFDHYMLAYSAADEAAEVAACAQLRRANAVDGFVLYGLGPADQRPRLLTEMNAPFVAFGRTGAADDFDWVDVDNEAGAALAVAHLIHHGHRAIGFVGWPVGIPAGDRRAQGWRDAVRAHHLPDPSPMWDLRADDSIDNGGRLCRRLLDLPNPPTAILAASDTLAVGAWQAARDAGIRLAVVGFDDTPTARALGISSVRQPIEEVGRAVIHALVDRLHSERARSGRRRLLAPSVVARASTADRAL